MSPSLDHLIALPPTSVAEGIKLLVCLRVVSVHRCIEKNTDQPIKTSNAGCCVQSSLKAWKIMCPNDRAQTYQNMISISITCQSQSFCPCPQLGPR